MGCLAEFMNKCVPKSWFILRLTLLSCIGGFLFGYDTGVISGALLLLRGEFRLDTLWQELIVSVTVGAAALFAIISGQLADWLGRRKTILTGSCVFTIGSIMQGVAESRAVLMAGRLIVGIGIGIASMTVPIYLSEISPSHQRGTLVTLNNAFITLGLLVAAFTDAIFNYVRDGWRYMLGLAGIPALIQLVGFLFMPETPRWLLMRGRPSDALSVLGLIYKTPEIAQSELELLRSSLDAVSHADSSQGGGGKLQILCTIFRTAHIRRALIIGCTLQFIQQFGGVNTIMYYSATIIRMAGVRSVQSTLWIAAGVALANFVFTFPGLLLVDRLGRRVLLLASLFGVTLSLLFLGIAFHLVAKNSPLITSTFKDQQDCLNVRNCDSCISQKSCGFCFEGTGNSLMYAYCLPSEGTMYSTESSSKYGPCENGTISDSGSLGAVWASDWCPSQYAYLPVIGLMLYLFCYSPGLGPMPWTINSEIYPQWARATAVGLATSVNWLSNLLVSMTFLSLMQAISKQGAYYFYAGISAAGLLFFFLFLPETRGYSLEEIEGIFAKPWMSLAASHFKSCRQARTNAPAELGAQYIPIQD